MIARELVAIPDYAEEVVRGLSARPKTLPCKLFYDERGSALFEEITRLPEYYLTRTEFEILQERSSEMVQASGSPISIVELGAGTATKTSTLLRAVARRQIRVKYFPVDISPSALAEAQERVRRDLPGAHVEPVIADFGNGFRFLSEVPGRKLVLYLGSSIGNFDLEEATGLLRKVRGRLSEGDALLLGTDMVKSPRVLVPAYDDAQGITAQFNKNILWRINRELSANFDLDSFHHIAEWNPRRSRMEIYLESERAQSVVLKLTGNTVKFAAGERIHTENSYKYTLEMVERMLCVAGFKLEKSWFDRRKWFGLHLARVGKIRNQIPLG
jgi:dimethylhistidine N-methyltransferase